MRSVAEHFALAAGFAGLAISSPLAKLPTQFSAVQVKVASQRKAPVLDLMKAYNKHSAFGAIPPTQVKLAASSASSSKASATATGSIAAADETCDSEYLCSVTVGNTKMLLDFDTGSSDFWAFSSGMPASEKGTHNIYNSADGTSKLMSGYTWNVTYGDGSGASGTVYSDKVVVGAVTATSMAIGAATSASWSDQADGIVGLAFSNINTVQPKSQLTFFDTVKANLKSPLFTADLKKGEAGVYDFGFIDSSKYTGTITYINANSASGFWEIPITGYNIAQGRGRLYPSNAVVDTGTSLMLLDSNIVTTYYQSIEGAGYSNDDGGYIFPCSASVPSFSLTIGGTNFTVPGNYMVYGQVDATNCYGGLQPNTGLPYNILGDIFIKSQFIIFNGSSIPTVGIAAKTLTDSGVC